MTENDKMQDHSSKQFDHELEQIRTLILKMGGEVEEQVLRAISLLDTDDDRILRRIEDKERDINAMEAQLEEACTQVIAKRQPAAVDLRMIVTVMKAIGDLERVGDKAVKIGRLAVERMHPHPLGGSLPKLVHLSGIALDMLRRALDAFARSDAKAAAEVLQLDGKVNDEFDAITRQLVTHMMEDPRTISRALDLMFIAKAIERVGDHAKNIGDYVIYMDRGMNVRHIEPDEVEQRLRDADASI